MAKKAKWSDKPSICPHCKTSLPRKMRNLASHFQAEHGRQPTQGEQTQFKAYWPSKNPYSETDFQKPGNEVSGGGVSPR